MYQHAINELQLAQDRAEAHAKAVERDGYMELAARIREHAADHTAAIAFLMSVGV